MLLILLVMDIPLYQQGCGGFGKAGNGKLPTGAVSFSATTVEQASSQCIDTIMKCQFIEAKATTAIFSYVFHREDQPSDLNIIVVCACKVN